MAERTDPELVVQARNGDKDAFGLLAQRYQTLALRVAVRMMGTDDIARDMVQEAVLQAYLSLDRLRDPARFRGWLCGIVVNVCRSYLRTRKADFFSLEAMAGGLRFDAVPLCSTAVSPEKIAEERELHEIVMAAVDTLEPVDRDITLLFYYEQLSLQEIAVLRGVSVGAVKVRLHRARQRLQDGLISQYPEVVPFEKRRKKMIKVTVADVVKWERTDDVVGSYTLCVVILKDEVDKRALPIWIGLNEGMSIAMGLNDFSTFRPMTYSFFAGLLKAVDARLEEVRIEKLQETTFYAVVKIRCGNITKEVDARPSDAIALAIQTDSPIYVAEEVMAAVGADIPKSIGKARERKGVAEILSEIENLGHWTQPPRTSLSEEEITRVKNELMASVFSD